MKDSLVVSLKMFCYCLAKKMSNIGSTVCHTLIYARVMNLLHTFKTDEVLKKYYSCT